MSSLADTKKVMFEIYRECDFNGRYRVVYFTELGEHDKEEEIGSALRGEHVYDGYILYRQSQVAKQVISQLLRRLNSGERLATGFIEAELRPYTL